LQEPDQAWHARVRGAGRHRFGSRGQLHSIVLTGDLEVVDQRRLGAPVSRERRFHSIQGLLRIGGLDHL